LADGNVLSWLGGDDDGGDHVGGGGDLAHDYGVCQLLFLNQRNSVNLPTPLQDPPLTCRPLVRFEPEQKLMKFAVSLKESVMFLKHQAEYTYVAEAAWSCTGQPDQ
jgi:hypothetical protein